MSVIILSKSENFPKYPLLPGGEDVCAKRHVKIIICAYVCKKNGNFSSLISTTQGNYSGGSDLCVVLS